MYEEGDGCDLNFLKAVECYRRAVDQNSPHAHFNLGCLLSNGKGVKRNTDAAQDHFRKVRQLETGSLHHAHVLTLFPRRLRRSATRWRSNSYSKTRNEDGAVSVFHVAEDTNK
jgi:hypothetical protein